MLFNIGFIAFFGLFIVPNIDNFAHLGGLIVGAVYGFLLIPSDLYADPRQVSKPVTYAGYAALGFFILTAVFTSALLFRIF